LSFILCLDAISLSFPKRVTVSKGFGNVDATVISDLENMQISLLDKGKIVSFGSGYRWHQVYGALQPHNLTTVGGRVPDVGISGFLLGGHSSSPLFQYVHDNISQAEFLLCRLRMVLGAQTS
jgi:FAD/FMN-containing dehydrogenase